jgi:hypothetical protein
VIFKGQINRGDVDEITGYSSRQSRTIVSKLIDYGLLQSSSIRAPLTLHFPVRVLNQWFPKLYPLDVL